MKHSSIASFLTGELSAEKFAEEIQVEVHECIEGLKSKGVGDIIVSDGPTITVNRNHVSRLFKSVLDNKLSLELANYLADGLIMSGNFEFADGETTEALYFLADDSRPPTTEETQSMLATLQ